MSTVDEQVERRRRAYEEAVAAGVVSVATFARLPIVALYRAPDVDGRPQPGVTRSQPWEVTSYREPVTRFDSAAWFLSSDDGGDELVDLLARLAAAPGADDVRALVIGDWGSMQRRRPPIQEIAVATARMPNLRALFLGAVEDDECMLSWITHDDITSLLEANPRLEVLRVRGSQGLALAPLRHESLRVLAFESAGLPGAVVRTVAACDLPALEELELWLGADESGGDSTVDDLALVLAGSHLPRLTALRLRNAQLADEIAEALASAPVVARLDELDLSLGTLSDRGAEALLAGQPLTHLKKLDLHHHFLSEAMTARLAAELPEVEIDVSDPEGEEEDDDERYVAVWE